jgi:hypothetical protein
MAAVGVAALICAGCQRAKPARELQQEAGLSAVEYDKVAPPAMMARLHEAGLQSSLAIAPGLAMPSQVMAAGKYLEVKHRLMMQMKGAELGKSLEAVVAFCGTLQCEMLSSNVATDVGDAVPSGSVSVRVAPGDLNKFLEFVGKQGKILTHATESQDRTTEIVDLEARMKNQTEFRDNLRKMMARPGVKVEDLLQIQEKLAEAQSTLDSEVANRKVLANETEKVAVEIEFRAEGGESRRGTFSAVGRAIRESREVLSESLAALITAVAAIIPWLIAIVPGGWLLRRVWKNWRKRRVERKAVA